MSDKEVILVPVSITTALCVSGLSSIIYHPFCREVHKEWGECGVGVVLLVADVIKLREWGRAKRLSLWPLPCHLLHKNHHKQSYGEAPGKSLYRCDGPG